MDVEEFEDSGDGEEAREGADEVAGGEDDTVDLERVQLNCLPFGHFLQVKHNNKDDHHTKHSWH